MAAAVAAVKARFPGREAQIHELARCLLAGESERCPVFVSGLTSTGKTAVVRELAAALRLRHAYVNCREASRTRPLLDSVLHQLKGGKRRREEGYEGTVRCDSAAAFLQALPAAAARRPGPAWIVLDEAQRLAGTDLLATLLAARETTGADVGLILISSLPWGGGAFVSPGHSTPPPHHVPFPAYRPETLIKILALDLPPADAAYAQPYRQFLQYMVPLLHRASADLLCMRTAAASLWPQYSAPLRQANPPREMSALSLRIRGEVKRLASELDFSPAAAPSGNSGPAAGSGAGGAGLASDAGVNGRGANGGGGLGADGRASSHGLAFELPYVSKFLLLAAYIASRNKPTSDRVVFDPTYGRRGRRDGQAADRQAEAAAEAGLRGPHAFPLERLLHIFYCVYAQREDDEAEEYNGDGGDGGQAARRGAAARLAHEVQVAEVQMQVSTLVALRLLSVSGGDPLEGGAYRCLVADDLARAVADNVRLRLGDFLKLA